MRRVGGLAVAALVVGAAGCGPGASLGQAAQPREGRAGLQVTGRVAGAQFALSDGAPQLVVGDCDPIDGMDSDVCAIAGDINGELFVLSVENPGMLEDGATIPVADRACAPQYCDDVDDAAVVDVQVGTGQRIRATGGQLQVRRVEPFLRYVGSAQLALPDGQLSVEFDLVPGDG